MSIHYFRFTCPHAGNPQRSRLLEQLLSRAAAGAQPVVDWRADAFRLIAAPGTPMPGVAAAVLCRQRLRIDASFVFMATAVHYVAEWSTVRLPPQGILTLRGSEADELALDFNRVWDGAGIRLLTGLGAGLFCATDEHLYAATRDPADVLGLPIEKYLPNGARAPELRRLMSEMEMWLFEHPVNRARLEVGAPVITGLWLWGGGSVLTSLPDIRGWTAGHDPFFNAWGERASARGAAPGVVVTGAEPGTGEWTDIESHWLRSSFDDLRSGRIARIDLSAGDRCVSVNAGECRRLWGGRFWSRTRPWWESFS